MLWTVRRMELKEAGWQRQDYVGVGECWWPPTGKTQGLGMSLRTAWVRHVKSKANP
jgi:hypothetical protein